VLKEIGLDAAEISRLAERLTSGVPALLSLERSRQAVRYPFERYLEMGPSCASTTDLDGAPSS